MIRRILYGCLALVPILLGSNSIRGDELLPVPADAELDRAVEVAREVYGKAYAEADTSAEKESLARTLLQTARQSTDSANRFAALRVARDIAALAGSADVAFEVIDQLAKDFGVDARPMKLATLDKTTTHAATDEQKLALIRHARYLQDACVADDDFEAAKRAGGISEGIARRARDRNLATEIRARNQEVGQIAEAYTATLGALATLAHDPSNPAANLTFGKYHCFVKGDWDKGLPMLALGSDPVLKDLATTEISDVSDPTVQVKLGDGWWDLAGKADETTKERLTARAAYWYRQAAPAMVGLVKDKVEKRLGEIELDRFNDLRIDPEAQRLAARLVFRHGGSLEVYGGSAPIRRPEDLPAGDFLIKAIEINPATRVPDGDVRVFAGIQTLESFRLSQANTVTDAAAAHLTRLPKLRILAIERCRLTDKGAQRISQVQTLVGLSMTTPGLTDTGLGYLTNLKNLQWLCVGHSRVTDNGLPHLSRLTALTTINLNNTRITDRGLPILARMPNLKKIVLQGTKVSSGGVQKLRRALPNCTLQVDRR